MKSATCKVASKIAIIAGLGGIEHGVGEVLQGNVAPDGMMIVSWPGWELFRVLAGEPAMTIIPNLLVTGILAILVSLVYLAVATVLIEKKNGGLAMVLLSVVMLLVGGGYGSSLLAVIAGLTATRINDSGTGWRTRLPESIKQASIRLCPWAYVACVVSCLLLLPGTIILALVFGTDNVASTVPAFIVAAFGTMFIAILTAFVYDGQQAKCHRGRAGKVNADSANRNDCIGETGKQLSFKECRA